MNKLKTLCSLVAAVGFSVAAANAQAAYVLDGWQLNTGGAGVPSNTINIGHLNLSGGGATVLQEVNAGGNPFVGASFSEFGLIFSTTYTVENSPGASDFGFPTNYNNNIGLRFRFENLSGVLTGASGSGALSYSFTPGAGDIFFEATNNGGASWQQLAELDVIPPSGGDLNDFGGTTGTNGNSTITGIFLSAVAGLFSDSNGDPLDIGDIFLDVRTNNEISVPAGPVVQCAASSGFCREIGITSNGSANLLRVPEPATLGLLGVSLIGLAFARRRNV